MSDDTIRAILVALLGAGGATFIWTMVKSIIAWKDSAEGREDKAVGRLEKYEEDCRKQLAWERASGAYWFRVTGILEHVLMSRGIPLPKVPNPPKRSDFEEDW